jgi:hypothetical protein
MLLPHMTFHVVLPAHSLPAEVAVLVRAGIGTNTLMNVFVMAGHILGVVERFVAVGVRARVFAISSRRVEF